MTYYVKNLDPTDAEHGYSDTRFHNHLEDVTFIPPQDYFPRKSNIDYILGKMFHPLSLKKLIPKN